MQMVYSMNWNYNKKKSGNYREKYKKHMIISRKLQLFSIKGNNDETKKELSQLKTFIDQKETQINLLMDELQMTKRKLSCRNVNKMEDRFSRTLKTKIEF